MPHFRPTGNKPFHARGLPIPGTKSVLAGWEERRKKLAAGEPVPA
jgi:hypothetical protein